jgi:hypothetical protein
MAVKALLYKQYHLLAINVEYESILEKTLNADNGEKPKTTIEHKTVFGIVLDSKHRTLVDGDLSMCAEYLVAEYQETKKNAGEWGG